MSTPTLQSALLSTTHVGLCMLSSFVVGLIGVLPLVYMHLTSSNILSGPGESSTFLNRWLSYATGSLLGEVFLHILPETWAKQEGISEHALFCSLWILAGSLVFFFIERIFCDNSDKKVVEGYLNLLANVIDNFTHGLAIGGSYVVSNRLGLLTTMCILIHEIPHEFVDFAIILRSGFSPIRAAKAQLFTASGSIFGALFAMYYSANISERAVSWILPFTAGGFLHIALVSLVPDIMKELSPRESCVQIFFVALGILSMCAFSLLMD